MSCCDEKASPRLANAYTSQQTLSTSFHISNFGQTAIAGATLKWQVVGSTTATAAVPTPGSPRSSSSPSAFMGFMQADSATATTTATTNTTICSQTIADVSVPQGPGTSQAGAAAIVCKLPDLGTFVNNPKIPMTLTVSAQLVATDGSVLASNSWRSRLYATAVDGPSPEGKTVYTTSDLCSLIPVSDMKCGVDLWPTTMNTTVLPGSVVVTDTLSMDALQMASQGATVLMLNNGTKVSRSGEVTPITLETDPAVYKTAWWLGSANDNNMGFVVYKNASDEVFPGMASEGWPDNGG